MEKYFQSHLRALPLLFNKPFISHCYSTKIQKILPILKIPKISKKIIYLKPLQTDALADIIMKVSIFYIHCTKHELSTTGHV